MSISDGRLETICNTLIKRLKDGNNPIPHRIQKDTGLSQLQAIRNQFEDANSPLQEKFPNFFDFLDDLLYWSYGLELVQTRSTLSFQEKAPDYPNQFLRKVDLICVVDYLLRNYPQKYGSYNFQRQREINGGDITLTAGFSENFWDNIFNDYDRYRGEDGKEICIFNRAKHALASYLHSAHPDIHYLHITSPQSNTPLCTAILMECSDGTTEQARQSYMIVEGVLGNFGELEEHKEEIYGFLWESIKAFSFKRGRNVFVNTSHSPNQREPEEFVQSVAREEKISELPVLKKRAKDMEYTHKFIFADALQEISNKDRQEFLYNGEQYSDTFHAFNAGEFPRKGRQGNSFFRLGGDAQGFEVRCPTGDDLPLTLLKLHEDLPRDTLNFIEHYIKTEKEPHFKSNVFAAFQNERFLSLWRKHDAKYADSDVNKRNSDWYMSIQFLRFLDRESIDATIGLMLDKDEPSEIGMQVGKLSEVIDQSAMGKYLQVARYTNLGDLAGFLVGAYAAYKNLALEDGLVEVGTSWQIPLFRRMQGKRNPSWDSPNMVKEIYAPALLDAFCSYIDTGDTIETEKKIATAIYGLRELCLLSGQDEKGKAYIADNLATFKDVKPSRQWLVDGVFFAYALQYNCIMKEAQRILLEEAQDKSAETIGTPGFTQYVLNIVAAAERELFSDVSQGRENDDKFRQQVYERFVGGFDFKDDELVRREARRNNTFIVTDKDFPYRVGLC